MGPQKTASGYIPGTGRMTEGGLGGGTIWRMVRQLAGRHLQYVDTEMAHFHYGMGCASVLR